jgi:dienelactone hydrolase
MHVLSRPSLVVVAFLAMVLSLVDPLAAVADEGDPVDPAAEQNTFAKQQERSAEYLTPDGLQALGTLGAESFLAALVEQGSDPERFYLSDACWSGALTCAGDTRLARWRQDGHGRVREVLFTGRNGATLNGHVWATRKGPAKRPLVVITPGSVQAPEQLYWWAAQVLAKRGYVVLTRDAQGQGQSDTFGEGGDFLDGVPSQSTGVTFYDHTQDALDFALSRKRDAYCPRKSRSGTSHCAKQERRVKEGRNTAFNPFARLVDRKRVGLAGHSYGAAGVTWIGQQDRRVDAVVAWDNLCDPTGEARAPGSSGSNVPQGCLTGGLGSPKPRVPSLGLAADYGLTPTPFLTEPSPREKSAGSRAFSKAGVDTGQIVIRGGTHYEWSFIPTPIFGATLRGIDASAWYTTAWFDRYVKGQVRSGTKRLLTDGWTHDARDREVDPEGEGNLLSNHYASRLDIGRDGGRRVRCEDLRGGCDALRPDNRPSSYSYLRIATSPDR